MSKNLLCLIAGILVAVSLAIYCSPTKKVSTKHNAVTLYGAITFESSLKTIQQIRSLQDGSKTPIYLYIDSPGGEVFSGIKIIDAMRASKRPVYTVDVGMAASMAAFIESFGVKRYMLPHAFLMYHNATGGFEGDVIRDRSQLEFINKVMDGLNANVSERSGVPLQYIQMKENSEWWLPSNEALANHLVDKIIDPLDFPAEQKADFPSGN